MRFFPRLASRLLVSALLAGAILAPVGCKQKTPEDRLNEAQKLLHERQVPLAMIRLKELVAASPETEAGIQARMLLAQVYASYQNAEYFQRAAEELKFIYGKVGIDDARGFESYAMVTDLLLAMGRQQEALDHLLAGPALALDKAVKDRLALMGAALQLTFEDEAIRGEGIRTFTTRMLEDADASVRGQAREVLARFYADQEKFAEANEIYAQYIAKYPDETVIPQLEIAQALNLKRLNEAEKAKALFDKGTAAMMAQVEEELNLEKRAGILNDISMYHVAYGDLETAEKLLRRVMAENVKTLTAIRAQFRIGEILAQDPAKYEAAMAHFEQMKRENPGSPIEQQANQMIDGLKQRAAAIAEAAVDAANGDTDTSPGVAPAAATVPAAAPAGIEIPTAPGGAKP